MSKTRSNTNALSGAWRLGIFAAAMLLPLLVTSCGKKDQEGEKKTVQKSEDEAPVVTALFSLKPVSFRYNKDYDATQTLAFGLIAEEVAEVYPDLVGRNPEGEPESVRYEQINAMLLNEFLKAHRKVQEFEANAAQQQRQIEALTAGLQKVSAQFEASKAAPKVANNN
jgi:Chaperone of endosialidase